MSTDPRIEAAAQVRMAEEECSYPINVHPDRCICETHGTPFEGMDIGDLYGHFIYMGGLCTYAVEQATATLAAADKASTVTTEDELDALPVGSVVVSESYRYSMTYPNYPVSFQCFYDGDWYRGGRASDTHPSMIVPARVIHFGDQS